LVNSQCSVHTFWTETNVIEQPSKSDQW
jgi:hypothetical protein